MCGGGLAQQGYLWLSQATHLFGPNTTGRQIFSIPERTTQLDILLNMIWGYSYIRRYLTRSHTLPMLDFEDFENRVNSYLGFAILSLVPIIYRSATEILFPHPPYAQISVNVLPLLRKNWQPPRRNAWVPYMFQFRIPICRNSSSNRYLKPWYGRALPIISTPCLSKRNNGPGDVPRNVIHLR